MNDYKIISLVFIVLFFNNCSQNQKNPRLNDMVLIPAGQFEMGITEERAEYIVNEAPGFSSLDWFKDEQPKHKVWIDDFYIDKYEVTFGQYLKFVEKSGYTPKGNWKDHFEPGMKDYPVYGVTWQDAFEYAKFYGKRLPTEAEWEKTAKGGKDYLYPWGDELIMGQDNCQDYNLEPVGQFPPNKYGIYDLGGNVQEWCMDWFSRDYYFESTSKNPLGPKEGYVKVIRGASINKNCAFYSHTGYRSYADDKSLEMEFIGFRCVYVTKKN